MEQVTQYIPCMLYAHRSILFINLVIVTLEIARGGYITWGLSSRTKKTWRFYNGPSRKHEVKQPCMESYGNRWSTGKTEEKSRISAEERIKIKRQDVQWAFKWIAVSWRRQQQKVTMTSQWIQKHLSQLYGEDISLLIEWEALAVLCWESHASCNNKFLCTVMCTHPNSWTLTIVNSARYKLQLISSALAQTVNKKNLSL